MNQKVSLTMCYSVKENECLIMNQRASSTMYYSVEENEDLIIHQRVNLTVYCSADESEDLIMSQKVSSTMHHSADENDVNKAMSCSVVKQNNSDTAINAILKVMRIHKFFNLKFLDSTVIFNNITTSNLTDYTSYSFKNLTWLICKQQKMNNLVITVQELIKKESLNMCNIEIDFSIFMINWFRKITDDIMIFHEFIYVFAQNEFRTKIIRWHHNSSLAEHFNSQRCLKLIQWTFNWLSANKNIKNYCRIYKSCQQHKTLHHRT